MIKFNLQLFGGRGGGSGMSGSSGNGFSDMPASDRREAGAAIRSYNKRGAYGDEDNAQVIVDYTPKGATINTSYAGSYTKTGEDSWKRKGSKETYSDYDVTMQLIGNQREGGAVNVEKDGKYLGT